MPNNTNKITILAGDIGGTNARFRVSQFNHGKRYLIASEIYKVADYANALAPIRKLIAEVKDPIDRACFGIAGPINDDDKIKLTNSNWSFGVKQIQKLLHTKKVKFINDFQAIGYGLESLTNKELYALQKLPSQQHGLKTFIGAGTGLGVGFANWDGSQYVVHPTEGGHTSFAPTDDLQADLLKYLRKKHQCDISTENVLSGPGIVNIYDYFREVNPFGYPEDEQLKTDLKNTQQKYPAIQIVDFALKHHHDQLSRKTLETFINIYGAKTGDLAFTLMPHGGIYVVGNIATRVLTKAPFNKIFIRAFKNKDKLAFVLNEFPIWLVLNTEIGLQGAENYALKFLD